jgi:hypothetical protein
MITAAQAAIVISIRLFISVPFPKGCFGGIFLPPPRQHNAEAIGREKVGAIHGFSDL